MNCSLPDSSVQGILQARVLDPCGLGRNLSILLWWKSSHRHTCRRYLTEMSRNGCGCVSVQLHSQKTGRRLETHGLWFLELWLIFSIWIIYLPQLLSTFMKNICLTFFNGASLVVLVVKNPPANAGDVRDGGVIPRSGRSPGGGGYGNLLQYYCLANPVDRGTWWAVVHGITVRYSWGDLTLMAFFNRHILSGSGHQVSWYKVLLMCQFLRFCI